MSKKENIAAKNVLGWFSVHAYDGAINFSLVDWVLCLTPRMSLIEDLESFSKFRRAEPESEFYCTDTPYWGGPRLVGSNQEKFSRIEDEIRMAPLSFCSYGGMIRGIAKGDAPFIENLTVWEAFRIADTLQKNRPAARAARKARLDLMKALPKGGSSEAPGKSKNTRCLFESFEDLWLKDSYGAGRLFGDEVYAKISLRGTDDDILEDFRGWLSLARKRYSAPNGDPWSESNIKKWHTYRLLPYFDLLILQEMHGFRLKQSELADCLFGDLTSNRVDRLRRETVRRADRVKNDFDVLCSHASRVWFRSLADEQRAELAKILR